MKLTKESCLKIEMNEVVPVKSFQLKLSRKFAEIEYTVVIDCNLSEIRHQVTNIISDIIIYL